MKITKLEAFHVNWDHGQSAWLRIWDDAGRWGIGEASPMDGGNASLEILSGAFPRILIGADPLDSAVLQHRLYHQHIKTGPDGALTGALAAVDIALWDLKGKILGQPIYKLLGGAWRKELPFYASIGNMRGRTVEQAVAVVEDWLKLEPVQVKIRFDPDKTHRDEDIPGDIKKARAVRKLVGDDFPLAFDGNNSYSVQGAIRVGRALEELGYLWFEEPVQHYHVESFRKISAALDIAIAAGEQEYTLQGVGRLIDAGVNILQPDIIKTGGFTGLLDMAALARCNGCDFLPHQTQPTIGHMANMHLAASMLHSHYPVELADISGHQGVVLKTPLRPKAGKFVLPDAPGLGLEFNEQELMKRSTPWRGA